MQVEGYKRFKALYAHLWVACRLPQPQQCRQQPLSLVLTQRTRQKRVPGCVIISIEIYHVVVQTHNTANVTTSSSSSSCTICSRRVSRCRRVVRMRTLF